MALALRAAPVFGVVLAAVAVVAPVPAGAGALAGVPVCQTWDPAWSPDGSRIAFGSVGTPLHADGSGGLIETVNPQGTELHVLTTAPPATASDTTFHHDFEPTWSPDSRRLAFVTDWRYYNSGTWDQWSLSVLDTSTGAVALVADSAADPTWSRAGLLGYILYDGPYGDTAGFVAGSRTFLNPSADVEWSGPSWSPDGSRLAFEADNSNGDRSEIFVMSRLGSYRPLVASYGGPNWSPDGRWIAYETPSGRSIDAISPDGKRHRHLLTLDPNSATNYAVAWSPDGAQVAIGTTIVTLATGRARDLPVDGSGDYPGPTWSPDGHWLVYASNVLQLVRPNGTGLHTINPCALTPHTS